jgi:acetyltransferase-like isoleucine patch superfamily enzyme
MNRIKRAIKRRLFRLYQALRIRKYCFLSNCENVIGTPIINQPVQMVGRGTIKFNGKVNLGVFPSPGYLSGYIYIEARYPDSVVEFGDGVWLNNNSSFVSEGPGIYIGARAMLGPGCSVVDSDFHDLHPDRRMTGVPKKGKVVIGENAFVGSNVSILKGVEIGKNSVVGCGAIVSQSIPENVVVVFGNPAKIVKQFEAGGK